MFSIIIDNNKISYSQISNPNAGISIEINPDIIPQIFFGELELNQAYMEKNINIAGNLSDAVKLRIIF